MHICSVEGCDKPRTARGFCHNHWRLWRKYGDPHKRGNKKPAVDFIGSAVTYDGDECLMWPYALKSGYGHVHYPGIRGTAARVVCTLVNGAPPTDRHQVAHSCGVRACVSPQHLRWSTAKDNAADRVTHGTSNRGSRHGLSKLTEQDVRAILAQPGAPRSILAEAFMVHPRTISDIRRRMSWRWLTATVALLVLSPHAMAQYYSPPAAPLVFPSTGQARPWWVPPSATPGTTQGTSLQSVPYAPPPQPPPVPPLPR